jgi:hypothetical protein
VQRKFNKKKKFQMAVANNPNILYYQLDMCMQFPILTLPLPVKVTKLLKGEGAAESKASTPEAGICKV